MAQSSEPVDGWWESPALAFAEGARVGYDEGLREAFQAAADLYGPWRFDSTAVVRELQARGRWPLAPAGGSSAGASERRPAAKPATPSHP